jgi:hypothetical protein
MDVFTNFCENPSILRVMLIIKICFQVLLMVLPMVVIITGIVAFVKPILSGKTEDMATSGKALAKKIIASLVVFMLPIIIPYILSLTGEDTLYDVKQCISHVSLEEVQYYEKIDETARIIQAMKDVPSQVNIDRAKASLQKIMSFAKEDTIIDFWTAITQAEIEKDKLKDQNECMLKGGKYEKGYCHLLAGPQGKPEGGGSSGSSVGGGTGDASSQGGVGATDYNPSTNGYGTTTVNVLDDTWVVVNAPVDLITYQKAVYNHRVAQNANTAEWSDKCLGFAFTHAWGFYTGNTNYTGQQGANYAGASNFTSFIDDNKQAVLNAVYEEITAGRPVVLQVNGNTQGTSRHFVAVVGYRQGVSSGSTIAETDLLIIDSWDAKLERMDTEKARFMTSGAQCHKKDYSGYRMHYIKQKSS